ncbi:MAG: hypothetical protein QW692_01830 [Nitrososphaerota archaeon]
MASSPLKVLKRLNRRARSGVVETPLDILRIRNREEGVRRRLRRPRWSMTGA